MKNNTLFINHISKYVITQALIMSFGGFRIIYQTTKLALFLEPFRGISITQELSTVQDWPRQYNKRRQLLSRTFFV